MTNQIKAVGFDLWDTLIFNINRDNYKKLKEFIKTNLGASYKDRIFKENINEEQMLHDVGVFTDLKKIKTLRSILRQEANNFKIYSDTIPTLEKLKDEGYKIVLVSNTYYIAKDILEKSGLTKYFDAIIFSYEVGCIKPQKEIFELMYNCIGVNKNEIIFVGNSLNVDYPANNYGIKSLLLDRNSEHKSVENRITSLNGIFKYLK